MVYNNRPNPHFRLVTRDGWNAREPKWTTFIKPPVTHLFFEIMNSFHCAVADGCALRIRKLQEYQLNLVSNPDIRYNFMICPDGAVFEGRGWDAAPRLPQKYKSLKKMSYYIGLIRASKESQTTWNALQAQSNLVMYGIQENFIHRKHLQYSIVTPSRPEQTDHAS